MSEEEKDHGDDSEEKIEHINEYWILLTVDRGDDGRA